MHTKKGYISVVSDKKVHVMPNSIYANVKHETSGAGPFLTPEV